MDYMAPGPRDDYLNVPPCIFPWYHAFSELAFDGEKFSSVCVERFIFKMNHGIVK